MGGLFLRREGGRNENSLLEEMAPSTWAGFQSLLYLLPTQPELKGNPRTQIMHTKYFLYLTQFYPQKLPKRVSTPSLYTEPNLQKHKKALSWVVKWLKGSQKACEGANHVFPIWAMSTHFGSIAPFPSSNQGFLQDCAPGQAAQVLPLRAASCSAQLPGLLCAFLTCPIVGRQENSTRMELQKVF